MTMTSIGRDATDAGTVTVHGSAAGFAQAVVAGRHTLAADEPTSVGGPTRDRTRTTSFSRPSDPARR